jgi:hypothetical protein
MGGKKEHITPGTKFQMLTYLGRGETIVKSTGNNVYMGIFRCDCGIEKQAVLCNVKNGKTFSCGCNRTEKNIKRLTKHGGINSLEYTSWKKMKARCLNPNDDNYHNYGGRGITICDEWVHDFGKFLEDMGKRPTKDHTLDRKDVNGNYTKSNCRWATDDVQNNNKRGCVYLTKDGETLTMAQWARKTGLSKTTIKGRLVSGYSVENILHVGHLASGWTARIERGGSPHRSKT